MADDLTKSSIQKTPKPQNRDKKFAQIHPQKNQVHKKSFWKKMKDAFFSKSISEVGEYLWKTVVHPTLLKLLDDGAANAIHYGIYGNDGRGRISNGGTHTSNALSYANNASMRNAPIRSANYQNIMHGMSPCSKELIYDILRQPLEEIARNGRVSVYSFAQMLDNDACRELGLSIPYSHTDQSWGWTYLGSQNLDENEFIKKVPGLYEEYVLVLPPAKPIYE